MADYEHGESYVYDATSQTFDPRPTSHGCKRAGGFVDSSCNAACDCHETQKLSDVAYAALRHPMSASQELADAIRALLKWVPGIRDAIDDPQEKQDFEAAVHAVDVALFHDAHTPTAAASPGAIEREAQHDAKWGAIWAFLNHVDRDTPEAVADAFISSLIDGCLINPSEHKAAIRRSLVDTLRGFVARATVAEAALTPAIPAAAGEK